MLTVTRFDNGQPANPGDKVLKGFTVNLTWSDQSEFTVPNDHPADSRQEAAKSLKQAGWTGDLSSFTTASTEKETHDTSQVGVIMARHPDGRNAVIDQDSKITGRDRQAQDDLPARTCRPHLDQAYGCCSRRAGAADPAATGR